MVTQDSVLYNSTQIHVPDSITTETITVDVNTTTNIELISVKKESYIPDWTIILLLLIFVILAWVKITSQKYLYSLVQSSFNIQTANRLFREKSTDILHPSSRLDLIFYLVFGTFIVHVGKFYIENIIYTDFLFFLICLGILLIFMNTKYLLYYLTSFLFKCQSETNEFIFYLKSNNRIMGVFMLPITTIMFFSSGISLNIYMYLGFLIIIFFSLNSLFRGFIIIARKDFSIYYLILYLCTFEILPLLIVWKVLW